MSLLKRITMDDVVKNFLDDLLNAPDVPKSDEPDVGRIEDLSPERFRLMSSIIKICKNITDKQISNYVNYLNKALENSGEFKKFNEMMNETKSTPGSTEEDFI